jgi:hypothetical protein
MPHPFDSVYYATAATTIPILYVALTFQGSTFEDSLRRYSESADPGVQSVSPTIKSKIRVISFLLITLVIGMVLIFGIYAEFAAVLALYQQRAGQVSDLIIMIANSLLLVLVASVPVVRFSVTSHQIKWSDFG